MRSEGPVVVLSVSVCVCVCVCVSTLILALQGTRWPISDTNGFRTTRTSKLLGDFPERTAFERYAVKTSEKANMHNRAGLPRTDLPAPRTLKAQEVTTEGVRRLPHAIY